LGGSPKTRCFEICSRRQAQRVGNVLCAIAMHGSGIP
jgi:hypothetical protein